VNGSPLSQSLLHTTWELLIVPSLNNTPFEDFFDGTPTAYSVIEDYHSLVVKHNNNKKIHYTAYVAIPSHNKFFGKNFKEFDVYKVNKIASNNYKDLTPEITFSDYSFCQNYWIFGFSDSFSDLQEVINKTSDLLKFLRK